MEGKKALYNIVRWSLAGFEPRDYWFESQSANLMATVTSD